MDKLELQKIFNDFLLNKGYKEENLRQGFLINNFIFDIVICDNKNNYLAVFRLYLNRNNNDNREIINHLKKHKEYLFPIPLYLVTNIGNEDFEIQLFENNELKTIEKDKFPSYEILYYKNELLISFEKALNKNKIGKYKSLFYAFSASFILGLSVFIFLNQLPLNKVVQTTLEDAINVNERLFIYNDNYSSNLDTIKLNLDSIYKLMNTQITKDMNLVSFNDRLKIIENEISNSPHKILSISNLTHNINLIESKVEGQEKLYNTQIKNIEEDISTLTNVIYSFVIMIVGTLFGVLFTFIFRGKKDNI